MAQRFVATLRVATGDRGDNDDFGITEHVGVFESQRQLTGSDLVQKSFFFVERSVELRQCFPNRLRVAIKFFYCNVTEQ